MILFRTLYILCSFNAELYLNLAVSDTVQKPLPSRCDDSHVSSYKSTSLQQSVSSSHAEINNFMPLQGDFIQNFVYCVHLMQNYTLTLQCRTLFRNLYLAGVMILMYRPIKVPAYSSLYQVAMLKLIISCHCKVILYRTYLLAACRDTK